MGKRLNESVKLIEKAYRRKMKKERWDQTFPSFKSFKIDNHFNSHTEDLRITVTDILKIDERERFSKISNLTPHGSNYIISSIVCPICRHPALLNKHWNSFICNNPDHERKIYEITRVDIIEKLKIKELVY